MMVVAFVFHDGGVVSLGPTGMVIEERDPVVETIARLKDAVEVLSALEDSRSEADGEEGCGNAEVKVSG